MSFDYIQKYTIYVIENGLLEPCYLFRSSFDSYDEAITALRTEKYRGDVVILAEVHYEEIS